MRRTLMLLVMLLLSATIVAPVAAQPHPDNAVNVIIPPKATAEEVLYRIRLATNNIVTASEPVSGTVTLKPIKVHLTIDPSAKPVPTIEPPLQQTTPITVTRFGWNRSNINDYPSATTQELSATLDVDVGESFVEVEAWSWRDNIDAVTGESAFYEGDFEYYRGNVTHTGTLTLGLIPWTKLEGYHRIGYHDAWLRYPNDPYRIIRFAEAKWVENLQRSFLPIAVR